MFDIARRDERGLLLYDDEFRRRLMTPKEIALSDEFVKKTAILIERYERREISKQEYDRLVEELDDEHTEACSRLYYEEFGTQSTTDDEKFLMPQSFATA